MIPAFRRRECLIIYRESSYGMAFKIDVRRVLLTDYARGTCERGGDGADATSRDVSSQH
jgi:hypothetical protein